MACPLLMTRLCLMAISSSVKLGLAYTGQFASDVTDSGVSSQLIVEF
jgi:hypothetical protein